MSYCGWTEQETLDTSIPAIELAYEGVMERLKLCYGADDEPPPDRPPPDPQAIAAAFRAAAAVPRR
jgi:hypothetical protein